ncbi:hypothetical protein POKO110462_10025 [Pontibacter korlensis]|uniref:STAS/SEC14 domain-containing protein n=1 Tax=Pontibacter korlensis TaxID=400092 RepID=A0A0E3ZIR4_9BACT|nr:hypothetical protein [Pontibacter korlensis]AKD04805.1 hypothetical protein PKOR_19015 [Pontibacter korlensis]
MRQTRSELLYRDTTIAIEFNPADEWIYVNWKGYQNRESVMDGCEKILELMIEHACFRILNDNTNVEGQWSAASRWLAEDWFPRMHEHGLQLFAWVYSSSVLSRLSTDKAVRLADYPDYIKSFDNIEHAKDWLRSRV